MGIGIGIAIKIESPSSDPAVDSDSDPDNDTDFQAVKKRDIGACPMFSHDIREHKRIKEGLLRTSLWVKLSFTCEAFPIIVKNYFFG